MGEGAGGPSAAACMAVDQAAAAPPPPSMGASEVCVWGVELVAPRQRQASARSACCSGQSSHDLAVPHNNVLLVVGALKLQAAGSGCEAKGEQEPV